MKPIIEIYQESNAGRQFRVKVNGKEIERLRSFTLAISNEKKNGLVERPFYTAEQYIPHGSLQTHAFCDQLASEIEDDGQGGI